MDEELDRWEARPTQEEEREEEPKHFWYAFDSWLVRDGEHEFQLA